MTTARHESEPAAADGDSRTPVPAPADVSPRESEARLRRVFETVAAGIVLSDKDGCIVSANPTAERILGLAYSEIDGRGFESARWKLLRPDGTPLPAAEMAGARALAEKRAISDVVMGVVRPDGAVSWITVSATPLFDAAGELEGVVGTFIDVTEREGAEEALRESEERYRDLFEQSPIAIEVYDAAGVLVGVNPACLEMFGVDNVEELRDFNLFADPNLSDEHKAQLRRDETVRYEGPFNFEKVRALSLYRTSRTGVIWLDVLIAPVSEVLAGYLVQIQDITERKRLEGQLGRAKDLLDRAGEIGHVGGWEYEVESGHVTWTDEVYSIYGVGRDFDTSNVARIIAFCAAESRPVLTEAFRRAVDTGEPYDLELPFDDAKGAHKWLHASGRPVLDDGAVVGVVGSIMDVTERTASEAALRESEANFRAFFDAMDDIIVVGTPDGRIVYANPALSSKLGYGAAALAEMRLLDLNPTDRRAEAEAIFAAMFRGERESCPLPLQTKSGGLIPAETRVWFGEWDGEACIFGICRDLSAEQEALQKFQQLFHGSPALMAVSTVADHTFTDVNDAFLAALGYSREEVIGRTVEDLGLIVQPDRQLAVAEDLQAGWQVGEREVQVRRSDGTVLDGLFTGEVIESQGRQHFLSTIVDQTERRRAEEALRESEERYRAMFEKNRAIKMVIDPVTAEIVDANPAAWQFYGYSRDELLALKITDINAGPAAEVRAEMARTAGEQVTDFVFRHRLASGEVRDVEVNSGPFETGGRTLLFSILHDITERKQAEDEVRRLHAELEERVVTRTAQRDAFNRELETFAYSAAHDLRAPLRAIDGFSKILVEDAAERLTPDELRYLERVRAAAQRMARMIDDLMGLSKVSRRPLLRGTVDVSATAHEVAEELRVAQPERRVELVIAPGMTAEADLALLRLVLVQLLDNAWKFTSKHDQARIEVGVTEAGRSGDGAGGKERAFFVRDDGAGFNMSYAKQLFGAFQRFHAARDFEGDGIGLATVQRLVLRHGGRVWAEAEVEKGATFFFTLPLAEAASV